MTASTSVQDEIAGSRRGDANARRALLERIEQGEANDITTVLSALSEIDAPEVLQLVARVALDDERPLEARGMAGRRICDLAVDALTARLRLAAPQPHGGPYDKAERERVRAAIRTHLPM
jgi:hypothetical protein